MWHCSCVARTFLSAAVAFAFDLDFQCLLVTDNLPNQCSNAGMKINPNGGGQECPPHTSLSRTGPRACLDRKYDYRRRLPHFQKAGSPLFVTFRKGNREPFSPAARDVVMKCCLLGNGKRFYLHAVVVMPEHVHLLLTPLRDSEGWPYSLPLILKGLKGASARAANLVTASSGPVWQDESFDHLPRSEGGFEEKLDYIRQNPVRRGLVKKPEDYPWLWINLSA